MRKKPFDQLSAARCCKCGKLLKQNVIDRKKATTCYVCHCIKEAKRGHIIQPKFAVYAQ